MNFRPVVFFVICRAAGCYRYFSPMVQPTGLQVQAAYACSSVSGIAMSWVPIVYMPLASLRSADVFHLRFGNVFFQRADVEACKAR